MTFLKGQNYTRTMCQQLPELGEGVNKKITWGSLETEPLWILTVVVVQQID